MISRKQKAARSATDAGIHFKTLLVQEQQHWQLQADMENTIKTVKSLEDSDLLIKGVSKTIDNEAKVQKGGFAGTL